MTPTGRSVLTLQVCPRREEARVVAKSERGQNLAELPSPTRGEEDSSSVFSVTEASGPRPF